MQKTYTGFTLELVTMLLRMAPSRQSGAGSTPYVESTPGAGLALYREGRSAMVRISPETLADLVFHGDVMLKKTLNSGTDFYFLSQTGVNKLPNVPVTITATQGYKLGDSVLAQDYFNGPLVKQQNRFQDEVYSKLDLLARGKLVWSQTEFNVSKWEEIGKHQYLARAGVGEGDQQAVRLRNPFYGSKPAEGVFIIATEHRRELYKGGKLVAVNGVDVDTGAVVVTPGAPDTSALKAKVRAIKQAVDELAASV